MLTDRKQDK